MDTNNVKMTFLYREMCVWEREKQIVWFLILSASNFPTLVHNFPDCFKKKKQ